MTEAKKVSLKSLLVPSKNVEVEYPGMPGFKISLAYLSRETLISIRKKATKTTFKHRTQQDELDDKLFLKLYAEAAIKGWRGLTVEYLSQLVPINSEGAEATSEVEYDPETALDLMQASADFESFISDSVTDLANFNKSNTNK